MLDNKIRRRSLTSGIIILIHERTDWDPSRLWMFASIHRMTSVLNLTNYSNMGYFPSLIFLASLQLYHDLITSLDSLFYPVHHSCILQSFLIPGRFHPLLSWPWVRHGDMGDNVRPWWRILSLEISTTHENGQWQMIHGRWIQEVS